MTLEELQKRFIVSEDKPKKGDLKKYVVISPYLKDKLYFVYFRTFQEHTLFQYLTSTDNYKRKEELFGINSEHEEVYLTDNNSIGFIQKKLPKKWIISDKKSKREIDVFITNINQENKELLHTLYTMTRKK